MTRPLQYSTSQRQQQYDTIRNAGLSRDDRNSAIAKLNKNELKYRKELAARDAKKQREEEARAKSQASKRAVQERARKDAKNQKRKDKRAADKALKVRQNTQRTFTNNIIDDMQSRRRFAVRFESSRNAGLSDVDLLKIIANNSNNGMWKVSLDDRPDSFYTLSDTTRNRLSRYVTERMVTKNVSAEMESDKEIVDGMESADEIIVTPIEPANRNERVRGSFFKYHNLTAIDASRYGIWTETVVSNYDDTCLVMALRNGGLLPSKIEIVKNMIKNRIIPMSDIPKICDAAQIQIRLKTKDTKNNNRRIFGKEYEEVYTIGCLLDHYFIIEPIEYTSYALKNYNELTTLPDFGSMYAKGKRDKNRYTDSFELVKTLIENKDTMLKEITMEDKLIASTQFYDMVSNEITNLEYNAEKCIKPVKNVNTVPRLIKNVFFDFETNPNGVHKPYLCRTFDGSKHREFIGDNCALKMLFSLTGNTRLIAHNATYDFRFLIEHLHNVSELARGNRLISAKGEFNKHTIEVKDSYHLISEPLRNFPSIFNIPNTVKEVMPYTLYTEENIAKGLVPISEALALLPTEEHIQFIQNLNRWSLIKGERDELYDIIQYSSEYCKIDCEILYKGYTTFRKWIISKFNLDIDTILTAASLAHQYFVNEGCYDEVNELGGVPQLFIQGCVVGGRVMCASNKKNIVNDVVNDFDAVSLYPSAMFRMDGFLKGVPKVIENLSYDWIKMQNGYFIDIKITRVGIERKFPLLCYKNEEGIRNFTNDMVGRTIRVDKYTLEDMIRFQGITFEVIRGYYFDEGYNTKIRDVITTIFNERLEAKKQGNPIQMIYKLLMNAGYGKSIMKPVETESRFFDTYNGDHDFKVYLSRNYNWITSFVHIGNKIKVSSVKTLVSHFNIAQVGVCILSNSKRIMNEVMCLAEDNDIDLYYQDTDSMHLKNADIPKLSSVFKNTYGRELIGKGLGQFHSDFDLPDCSNIVAVKSIFLGKKCYIDKLQGTDKQGNTKYGFHIRMKGIPEKCIHYVVEKTNKYKDVMELYEDLYNGKEVAFDLTNGGSKANFKFNKNYTINTLSMFSRSIKF
jgi:hypothetical protein